jgi:hypothetical protein
LERRFVKDYRYEEGKLVYTGRFYSPSPNGKHKKKAAVCAVLKAVLLLGMLFTGNLSTRWWPVGVPLTAMIVTLPLFCYETARFLRLPDPMKRRHYEGAFTHIGLYAGANFLLACVSCVSCVVWLIKTKNAGAIEYFYPFFGAALAALAAAFFKTWRSLQKDIAR